MDFIQDNSAQTGGSLLSFNTIYTTKPRPSISLNSNSGIYNPSDNVIKFFTNNIDALTINENQVLIGNATGLTNLNYNAILNAPDISIYATTTNLSYLSNTSLSILNSHTTSISNLNISTSTLFNNYNTTSTLISNLNTTSTTIFTNLNSLSTNSILSISNLNTTSTTLFTSLSNKQDIYTAQRQYPSRVFDSSTSETTTTFLGKTVYTASFTLNNNGSTYDYGTYICYYNTNYGTGFNPYNVINNNTGDRGIWVGNYNGTNGFYSGPATNYIVSDYIGDWFIIKFPRAIIITKIVFYISPSLAARSPGLWKIYGSNDGITWDYLANASNITTRVTESNYSSGSYTQNIVNSGISYLYYGLVVNQLAGNNYYLDFAEWQIQGVEKISCQADWATTIINKPDLSLYATTTNLNSLSTNSILSINNLNTTSTTLLGLINGHTTSISNLNTTSTTIFTNLNSLSTNSILSISNLNTTSTTLLGLVNSHTTSISNLNTTSTTIFTNLNSLSTNSILSSNNLNTTSTTIFTNLNSLSTNSILSINNLNTTSTSLLGLINGHTTSISFLNSTSTTLFTTKENALTFSAPLTRTTNTISLDLTSYLTSATASSTYATITNLNAKENALTFSAPLTRTTNTISLDVSTYITTTNANALNNRFFNNNGNNHGNLTDFNSSTQFGYNYILGTTNGPGVNGAGQYYSWDIGLGANYAFGTYRAQFALPRNVGNPYLCVRYQENGAYTGWNKISSGYADTAEALSSGNKIISGNLNIRGANPYAVPTGYNTGAGCLTIGDINTNFYVSSSSNWGTTCGFLMECQDITEISIHDAGNRLASFMYYQGGSYNIFYVGRDIGWGTTPTIFLGSYIGLPSSWRIQIGTFGSSINSMGLYHTDYNSVWFFRGTQANINQDISDIRTKKNIENINNSLDLINQLEPKKYIKLVDRDEIKEYGFIAQDIEKVIPEVVYNEPYYIADIYEDCVFDNETKIFISTKDQSAILKVGTKIKIVLDKVDGEIDMNNMNSKWCCVETEIVEVIDEFTYKTKNDIDIKETEIFVYGTLKKDFKTIDYKSLHAINIQAIKDLYKIIQDLQNRISILENK